MREKRLILGLCVFDYRDERLNGTSKRFHIDGTNRDVCAARSTATENKSMNKS